MADGCGHAHGHGHGLSGLGLSVALDEAEARCREAGERLTAPRRRVLELLLESGQPTKAYDLIAAFGADGQSAKPPTVYRALDFLERIGMAHRIASISAYVACVRGEAAHAAAFLICDCCGDARELDPPSSQPLQAGAAAAGYRLDRVTIEAHGLCGACRPA